MFTLSFGFSRSKNYRKAVDLSHDMGGHMVGGTMILDIQDYELLYCYESIYPLLGIIQKWGTVKGSYDGMDVDPFRFLFGIWRTVGHCAQQRNDSWDDRHCWQDRDNEGWGCKQISSFSAHNYGSGRYERSSRFRYNFGSFENGLTWKVNKRLIIENLQKEIASKSLRLCPFFSNERILKAIEGLPDNIRLDDVCYAVFRNGSGKPVNIRHVDKQEPFFMLSGDVGLSKN